MNRTQESIIVGKLLVDCEKILGPKGSDYGGVNESFENIATVASIIAGTKLSAIEVDAVLMAVKLSRMGNLRKSGKPPANESFRDTLIDLMNYTAFNLLIGNQNGDDATSSEQDAKVDVPKTGELL